MKKITLLVLLTISTFVFSQTNFQNGYTTAFADALCYGEGATCQRRAPYTSDIPLPNYDESSTNYMDGYARGVVAGFAYKNQQKGTKYNYTEYAQLLFDRKKENRRKAVEQSENYFNEDLQRRYPRPTDKRQQAVYDAIMSNDL